MKRVAIAIALASATAASAANYNAFGDSITYGYNVPSGSGYVSLLDMATGLTFNNHGVIGAMAGDQAPLVYGVTPGAGDIATIFLGVNDESYWGTNATTLGYYRAIMQDMAAYLATPTKLLARAGGITYSGQWVNTAFISVGSNVNGSSAAFSFAGTALYIDTIFYTLANGTADVYVDGAKVGSFTTAAPGIATKNGAIYTPALVRFGGLAAGSHTGNVVVTSATGGANYVYLNWVGGNQQTVLPQVLVAGPTRFTAAGYAAAGGSDANVAAYNAAIVSAVNDLVADGLAVTYVDAADAVDPATELGNDGIHPNVAGHMSLESVFYAAMGRVPPPPPPPPPVVTYSQTGIWRGSDGSYCLSATAPTAPCPVPLHP